MNASPEDSLQETLRQLSDVVSKYQKVLIYIFYLLIN
jgi:hypothetical protein